MAQKNIAVIGSGISGLTAAHLLSRRHSVTLFEAGEQIGGHTATKPVRLDETEYQVDTGFIVFNDRTYPNFIKLLSHLGVSSQSTEMGFSVTCPETGLEYSGSGFKGLFAQRRNLLSPRFLKMLTEVVRFNRACTRAFKEGSIDEDLTLGEYLQREGYSEFFQRYYILPMVSAIWSSGLAGAASMPLAFFVRFFHNHGLLTIANQPQWYTVKGGSQAYLGPISQQFRNSIRTQCPVLSVRRLDEGGVQINTEKFGTENFDEVVIACHSDQALTLLADPSEAEYETLSAIPYQSNQVTLHTDTAVLPNSKRAWASWNYRLGSDRAESQAVLTYNMNMLQNLEAPETFCVSVNADSEIDPSKILGRYSYSHPVFNRASIAAQQGWEKISGKRNTHFCGAYWRNGFHEDGVVSGLKVAAALGEEF